MRFADKTRYQVNAFNTILFFASEEGTKPIPNSEREILLEIAAAVTEYLGGNVGNIPQPIHIPINDYWWQTLNRVAEEALKQNSKRLNPALVEMLSNLLKVGWEHDHGESWWESSIRWHLMFGQRGMDKVFYLTVPEVQGVRENIQKTLDTDTVEHCKQIGTLMRKYIARDLANH